jgi:hypothetical protein
MPDDDTPKRREDLKPGDEGYDPHYDPRRRGLAPPRPEPDEQPEEPEG